MILIVTISIETYADENSIFDANKRDPGILLNEMFQSKQVLILGSPGHMNAKVYYYFQDLLDKISQDPDLTTIVLERFGDQAKFYETLSKFDTETSIKLQPFSDELSLKNTMCASPEWAFSIAEFMPKIREINKLRPAEHQLVVTSIDGMDSHMPYLPPRLPTQARDCTFAGPQGEFTQSATREEKTARNFERAILPKIRKGEKVIIMYHYAHILPDFKACMPVLDDGKWYSQKSNLTWFSRVLARHPEIRGISNFVLFDEQMRTDVFNVPALKVNGRQSLRDPKTDFAVPLGPLASELKNEIGLSFFTDFSFIKLYLEGSLSSTKSLPEEADATIWMHDSPVNYSLGLSSKKYLPQCDY